MSFQQIAKLYLRGSIYSKKMKNLPKKEVEYLSEIIEQVIDDPILQHCKNEFCGALSRTIKNEYLDLSVGMQDYRIAIMRATIAAKINSEKYLEKIIEDPIQRKIDSEKFLEKIIEDPIQRKKWYQTWAFNYLKQILRENKIPTIENKTKTTVDQTLLTQASLLLSQKNISHNIFNNTIYFKNLTQEAKNDISQLLEEYFKRGGTASLRENRLIIDSCDIINKNPRISVREYSFNNQDSNVRDYLESRIPKTGENDMEEHEIINKLKERIPDYAYSVLEIYLENERPNEYVSKYGNGRPRATHVSEFLGISLKEAKRIIELIKIHLTVLQLGH